MNKIISINNSLLLKEYLVYLHVQELKNICHLLSLPAKDIKGILIKRIIMYLETGIILNKNIFPKISCAVKNNLYPLSLDAYMIQGAYKNDLKTRLFFKSHIGNHFHFTASGIDWLNYRWIKGSPPTYQEYIDFWNQTYEFKKNNICIPKEEWAYIRFMQLYIGDKNHAHDAWHKKRQEAVDIIKKIIHEYLNS